MNIGSYDDLTVRGDGITVSLLIWRRFRKPMPGLYEATLDANPGLADIGVTLPVGTTLRLPIPVDPATASGQVGSPVRLW